MQVKSEHSAILPTSIKLPFVIKIYVLPIFELPLKTGLTFKHKGFDQIVQLTHWPTQDFGTYGNSKGSL